MKLGAASTPDRRLEAAAREAERERVASLRQSLTARGLADLFAEVAKSNFVTVADILGRSRDRSVVRARGAICVALYQAPYSKSTVEIAKLLDIDSSGVARAVKGAT